MRPRSLTALVLIVALGAQAEPAADSTRTLHAVLIGAVGLSLAGGYATGAVLTGDQPSAVPLAVTGGVISSGLLSTAIALGLGARRKDPGSMASYVLVPLISGVISAVLGGVLAGFFARDPGTLRTVTHVAITSMLVLDTISVELARLLP